MPKIISATRTLAWVGATRTCLAVTSRVTTSNRSSYSTSSQAGTGGECEGYNTVRPVPFHSPLFSSFPQLATALQPEVVKPDAMGVQKSAVLRHETVLNREDSTY